MTFFQHVPKARRRKVLTLQLESSILSEELFTSQLITHNSTRKFSDIFYILHLWRQRTGGTILTYIVIQICSSNYEYFLLISRTGNYTNFTIRH